MVPVRSFAKRSDSVATVFTDERFFSCDEGHVVTIPVAHSARLATTPDDPQVVQQHDAGVHSLLP